MPSGDFAGLRKWGAECKRWIDQIHRPVADVGVGVQPSGDAQGIGTGVGAAAEDIIKGGGNADGVGFYRRPVSIPQLIVTSIILQAIYGTLH